MKTKNKKTIIETKQFSKTYKIYFDKMNEDYVVMIGKDFAFSSWELAACLEYLSQAIRLQMQHGDF